MRRFAFLLTIVGMLLAPAIVSALPEIAISPAVLEIKAAFRQLARANHPDHHPGDTRAEARFKEASEAYGVLGDSETRAEYDRLRYGAHPTYGILRHSRAFSGLEFFLLLSRVHAHPNAGNASR